MLGEYGDRQACLKRIVELKDLHRFSSAGTMTDGLNDTAHETAPWRRILNADRRGWVLIGVCTLEIGVHVHGIADSMCATALPYVAGCLTVAARPPERRRRSGALRPVEGSDPPDSDASIGIVEGSLPLLQSARKSLILLGQRLMGYLTMPPELPQTP